MIKWKIIFFYAKMGGLLWICIWRTDSEWRTLSKSAKEIEEKG